MVSTSRLHPFRLWLLNNEIEQQAAAEALGVTPSWLSNILKRKGIPSRALYRGIVAFTRGGVTMKELCAFQPPSEHSRKILPAAKPVRKRARKTKPERSRMQTEPVLH